MLRTPATLLRIRVYGEIITCPFSRYYPTHQISFVRPFAETQSNPPNSGIFSTKFLSFLQNETHG